MKTTEQIDRISEISISNYNDSWILVDSDELNLTGKMRLTEWIKFVSSGFILRSLKFSNGNLVKFTNGNTTRVSL